MRFYKIKETVKLSMVIKSINIKHVEQSVNQLIDQSADWLEP